MKRILLVLISSVLFGAATITAPRDPARYQQAADAVQAAMTEGNYSTELREFRRLLELHPNDPQLQAQFYLAMGAAAEKAGETKDAEQYRGMSHALDMGIDARPDQSGGTIRGEKGDMAVALMGAAMQSFAAISKARDDAKMKRAMMQQQMMQPQMQPQQFQPGLQPQPMMYPQAPASAPGYMPPAQPMPMPGYAPDPSMNAGMPMPYPNAAPQGYQQPAMQYPPPQPVQGYPQAQPPPQYQAVPAAQPAPGYPAAPPAQPQYQQNPAAQPAPQYQAAPPAPPQYQQNPAAQPPAGFPQQAQQYQQYPSAQGMPPPQVQPPSQGGRMRPQMPDVSGSMNGGVPAGPGSGYSQPVDPYRMRRPMGGDRQYTRRGEAMKPIRVVHDHSQLGDKAYFEPACGALLTVEDGEPIFTSSLEEPRSIAASEIVELRMNVEVGRAIGAFHILTKRGLYLNLAPEAATREEGRMFVEALRKQLGLGE